MAFRYVGYKKKYKQDAARMMSKTWDFDKHLAGLKDRLIVYKLMLCLSYIESDYRDLVVDNGGRLLGFLFAGSSKKQIKIRHIFIGLGASVRWLLGQFGKRKAALTLASQYAVDFNKIMADGDQYDNEIKLFFVDENTRGMGLGKKLMDRYISHCKSKGIDRVILMTDEGCNYGFYEHYGFRRISEIHSELPAKPELNHNGFAYAYEVNKSAGQ